MWTLEFSLQLLAQNLGNFSDPKTQGKKWHISYQLFYQAQGKQYQDNEIKT